VQKVQTLKSNKRNDINYKCRKRTKCKNLIAIKLAPVCRQAHEKIQHIQKMADVMWSAVSADSQPTDVTEYVAQLKLENATLRELLSVGRHSLTSPVCSQAVQTDATSVDEVIDVSVTSSSCSETDAGNSTVVEISRHEPTLAVWNAVAPQTASSLTELSVASGSVER